MCICYGFTAPTTYCICNILVEHNFGYWKHSIARSNKVYNFLPLKVFLRFFFVSWIGNSHGTRCKYVSCTNNRSRMFFFLCSVRVYHTVGDTYWIFVGHFFVLAHCRKCMLLCNSKPWQNKKKITENKNSFHSICTALFFAYHICTQYVIKKFCVLCSWWDFSEIFIFCVLIFNFSFLFFLSFFALINQMTHFIVTFFVFEEKNCPFTCKLYV